MNGHDDDHVHGDDDDQPYNILLANFTVHDWKQSGSSGRIATTERARAGPGMGIFYLFTCFVTESQYADIGMHRVKHVTPTHQPL